MKKVQTCVFICLFVILSGCATIAGENTRSVRVISNPSGAKIYVQNELKGVTPSVVTLPQHLYGGKTLTLTKPGYLDENVIINTQLQPIAILDILFWPSFLVDAATGKLLKIDPNFLNINKKLQIA